jgi:hypothetical protein
MQRLHPTCTDTFLRGRIMTLPAFGITTAILQLKTLMRQLMLDSASRLHACALTLLWRRHDRVRAVKSLDCCCRGFRHSDSSMNNGRGLFGSLVWHGVLWLSMNIMATDYEYIVHRHGAYIDKDRPAPHAWLPGVIPSGVGHAKWRQSTLLSVPRVCTSLQ